MFLSNNEVLCLLKKMTAEGVYFFLRNPSLSQNTVASFTELAHNVSDFKDMC